ARGLAAAGALAGVAYLARPEGALLLPLGVAAAAGRRHRAGGLVVYLGAGLLVMAPVVVALHARSGRWELSPREARIMRSAGLSARGRGARGGPHRAGVVAQSPLRPGLLGGGALAAADPLRRGPRPGRRRRPLRVRSGLGGGRARHDGSRRRTRPRPPDRDT